MVMEEKLDSVASQEKAYSDPISIQLEIKTDAQTKEADIPAIEKTSWKIESVRKGDNLSKIFKRIGLTPQQLHQVITLDDNTKMLKKLRPGEAIAYQVNQQGQLLALKYAIDIQRTLYIESEDNKLASRIENKSVEFRTAYASGTITGSLFAAGKSAGLTDTQVMQLANIFDWDIDFILDIREGDSFSMLYQEKFMEGEKIGNGEIIAAQFVNQGKKFTAVRYTDSKDQTNFYTPEGLSMRKAFLRAPLNFSYISSRFKPKRFHPILKRWKAHRGIDYRAPTGTPIRAAGDGKVIASSYSKYNGKYVFLQHGQGIVTKYLHMSRRAVSKNKRVKQGQVIGYVGATGLAEAPHLHYEFVVNGVHRNPRTVKLPQAKPIAKSEKERFTTETAPWINQLVTRNTLSDSSNNVAP
ncbi:peptidoglycan DD-metalloendopeptidase family protein [Aliikangiella coralliicola]|uniref:Peptidoglycan DD-metalloendopeptidase family protein n=2 Tax=Aliikangiella coralliicola TaxID=2592383 RepID=A0A545U803_9GAMM|nr:peptidoglycan DD-metalloendopeptidase family protein [Aliikangiella coralliicola]